LAQNDKINQNPTDTTPVFAIKQVTYQGNVQYVNWSNAGLALYESKWVDRAACFATPSNISITGASSFDGSSWNINFNWIASTGSSRYYILANENGRYITNTVDAGSPTLVGGNNTSFNLKLANNTTSFTLYKCRPGYTYSVSIYPYNGYGQGSASTLSIQI
jgi:hypothetical protein